MARRDAGVAHRHHVGRLAPASAVLGLSTPNARTQDRRRSAQRYREGKVATVITVHGTYAHIVGPPGSTAPAELPWWQPGSVCEQHLRGLLDAKDGNLNFTAFEWSGENSESARRKAGSELLAMLQTLEAKNETYCLVAHSHGGSVIASALVESVARKVSLNGLKKWITVGTPFVALKKERFLFARLTLPRKIVLVASMMLLFMFLFYIGGQILDGTMFGRRETQWLRLLISGTMMGLPFIVFYGVLKYFDYKSYILYRPGILKEAEKRFAGRWLALNHDDDEAVQGLKLLPSVQMNFFDPGFAVPFVTLAAIFILPLAYLLIVSSPPAMVAIADVLKTKVYDVDEYPQAEAAAETLQQQMRGLRQKLREARATSENSALEPTKAENARQRVQALRREIAQMRENLLKAHPELPQMQRAARFKRRFFERDGKACEGGILCGAGRDFGVNSALLYHIVTDELASAFVDADTRWGPLGGLMRLMVPLLLVPVVFAGVALVLLMLIRYIAGMASRVASSQLNRLTQKEITRSVFGNDTEGEVAVGSDARPAWIAYSYGFLPMDLAAKISDYSNQMSFQSLAKFRNAISTLEFSADEESNDGILATYLTWRELIHTAYFEVEEFRKLLGYAIAQVEGFRTSPAFSSDPDFDRVHMWHKAIRPSTPLT
jgi:hypothetical protein